MAAFPGVKDQMACLATAGGIAGVAFDVTVREPLAADDPLLDVPHWFVTATIEVRVLTT